MGSYQDQDQDPAQYTTIVSLKLASKVPEAERVQLEILRTDTPVFAAYVESRRNRYDAWNVRPAGYIDVCTLTIPVRKLGAP